MVDRHRRNDGVEAPERGQRLRQVVLHELDVLVVREALACRPEHELGEVKTHAEHFAVINLEKGEQAAVARAEVEDAPSVARHMLEQDALSLCPAWILIRPAEIPTDMLGGRPFLGGHAFQYEPASSRSRQVAPWSETRVAAGPEVERRWYAPAMRATIDGAGRLVVPKALRDELGFAAGTELELEAVNGRLEVAVPCRFRVEKGPHGVRFAADAADTLSAEQVRDLLERGRR